MEDFCHQIKDYVEVIWDTEVTTLLDRTLPCSRERTNQINPSKKDFQSLTVLNISLKRQQDAKQNCTEQPSLPPRKSKLTTNKKKKYSGHPFTIYFCHH